MLKNLTAQKSFLIISLTFGILTVIITPPSQPQDEIAHFNRAWQVSTGQISSIRKDQRLGGYVPISFKKMNTAFRPYYLNNYNKISPKQLWSISKIELEPEKLVFTDFTNTALYSGVLYLPQALGIFIGRQFELGPFWLVYLGRIFNLLTFLFLTYYAIKIMPFKKWLIVLLATLPMSFIVNSSLSADGLVNSISYLAIALFLKFIFKEDSKEISYLNILIIIVLSVLLGMAKLVYIPIVLLTLLIFSTKISISKVKIITVALAIITGFGTGFIQKSIVDSKYIPYSEYNIAYRDYTALNKGCDINKQMDFIKTNTKHTAKIFIKSFFNEFKYMAKGYIGIFGWGHIYPPLWFVFLAYLILIFAAITNHNFALSYNLTLLQRGYFLAIAASMVFLIMLSQYLSWDMVGEEKAYPLIGRYFIPVFPLIFIALSKLVHFNRVFFKQIKFNTLLFFVCVFFGILELKIIIENTYTYYNYRQTKWELNYAFKNHPIDTNRVQYIISGPDTIAEFSVPKGDFLGNEKTFTGNRSLKLFDKNPYGFTLKIFKGTAKDKIVASCRTYGVGGYINFQEYPEGVNNWVYRPYYDKDSLDWKYQEAEFILPNDIKKGNELRVFLWWPENDCVYIDDYKVQYLIKEQ